MERKKDLIGIIFSMVSWWICILGAKYLTPEIQLISFSLFIFLTFALHFYLYIEFPRPFILFYLSALIMGLAGDGLLFLSGQFNSQGPQFGPYPYWLLTLWIIFPFNFLHSFKKFTQRPLVGIFFGLIGGPLAYSAGPKFEILTYGDYTLIFVGLFWMLYMACISWLTKKLPL